jgi:hypothetical protein
VMMTQRSPAAAICGDLAARRGGALVSIATVPCTPVCPAAPFASGAVLVGAFSALGRLRTARRLYDAGPSRE